MTEWIKCSDEMPPHLGQYLLYTEAKEIRTGRLNEAGLFPDDDTAWDEEITHWAELPEAPHEKT